jgi:hypothetical protein
VNRFVHARRKTPTLMHLKIVTVVWRTCDEHGVTTLWCKGFQVAELM